MGVVVSEMFERELESDFRAFVAGLSDKEKPNGEPKGYTLTLRSRSDFCDLLNGYSVRGLMLTPVLLDMTSITEKRDYFTPAKMQASFEEFSKKCQAEDVAESYREFGRRFGSLSIPQAWRVFAWAAAFREAIEHAMIFLCSNGHEDNWEVARFEVDAVSLHGAGLEETIFSTIVFMWLSGWTMDRRMRVLDEIHTSDNPFVVRYMNRKGLDLVKLLGRNIHFVDSRCSWGIQIADIAANIVLRAAHDLDYAKGDLYVYASLMRSSPYGTKRGPGLINPTSDKEPDRKLRKKFGPMFDILKHRAPLRW